MERRGLRASRRIAAPGPTALSEVPTHDLQASGTQLDLQALTHRVTHSTASGYPLLLETSQAVVRQDLPSTISARKRVSV